MSNPSSGVPELEVTPRDPADDLHQVAFILERALESPYRVKAFRTAARAVEQLPRTDLQVLADSGQLAQVPGIGERTAQVINQSLAGTVPEYLTQMRTKHGGALLSDAFDPQLVAQAHDLRLRLHGDLHSHSDWSDGGSSIELMARTAARLGHQYLALTDHSPRLTVAHGLSAARVQRQLQVIAEVNVTLADQHPGFRLRSGSEVDILNDGTLDHTDEVLAQLDVVVASAHSELRMSSEPMTARLLAAIANPHTDVLGHCTNRYVISRQLGGAQSEPRSGKTRPPSTFDAAAVFAACAEYGVAVEINCRPERLDPPRELLRMAVAAGCLFSIDTDAHAPGQLDWQLIGCARAVECGVPAERIVNAWPLTDLVAWAHDHQHRAALEVTRPHTA